MKTKAGINARGVMVVALPLFMAVGCAGNKQNMLQSDALQTDAVQIDAAKTDAAQSDVAQSDVAQSDALRQQETERTAIASMDASRATLDCW